ncbi:MAG: hypothetical protein QNJ73_11180 [Gammaproteobacteria bacterium]|nr:hypothetical protein [Gammaproteobacteria bacterium]
MTNVRLGIVVCCLALYIWPDSLAAQEIEPRTYSNTPVGVSIVGTGYTWTNGAVLLDPALPIEDLDADLHAVFLRYARAFGLLGQNAKLKLVAPYVISVPTAGPPGLKSVRRRLLATGRSKWLARAVRQPSTASEHTRQRNWRFSAVLAYPSIASTASIWCLDPVWLTKPARIST